MSEDQVKYEVETGEVQPELMPKFNTRAWKAIWQLPISDSFPAGNDDLLVETLLLYPPTRKQLLAIPGCGRMTTMHIREEIARTLAARIQHHLFIIWAHSHAFIVPAPTNIKHHQSKIAELLEAQERWSKG